MFHIKSKVWSDLTKIQTEIDKVTKADLANMLRYVTICIYHTNS